MNQPDPGNALVTDLRRSPFAKQRPAPVTAVRVDDHFWSPLFRLVRETTLPSQWEQLVVTGRIDNFWIAAGKLDGEFTGRYFNDSDVYKWLEAASWALLAGPDPTLEAHVDETIAAMAAAQRPDGYLNSYFSGPRADERWTNLDLHELYCAGHLFQAAVAHHRVTGSTALLEIARRFADHICATFGPEQQAERVWADGHPEVEMGLVELYRETGNRAYLDQAELFINVRGHGKLGRPYGRWGPEYHQDHQPLREQEELKGHAVRALYLVAGATDVVLETGEAGLQTALERLWTNTRRRKTYVTGGLGARHDGEAFGDEYELPNATAYCETCAGIAAIQWNSRLLALTGDSRYADVLEHTLYNAVLPGLGQDGFSYFYVNPLADNGHHRRQPWFTTACCPPNIARLLMSLPGYAASTSDDAVWLHLYLAGTANLPLPDGRVVRLRIATRYPWDGEVDIAIDTPGDFAINLRTPAWAEGARLEVGDHPATIEAKPGEYVRIRREWRAGDTLHLTLPMPVERIVCHPAVLENAGRIALMRGPLVYCAEGVDHPDTDVQALLLPTDGAIAPSWRPDLLGGVVTLIGEALSPLPNPRWDETLYQRRGLTGARTRLRPRILNAVPYFAWANRAPGAMQVWLGSWE